MAEKSIGEQLAELAQHCAEGKIAFGVHDISHHRPGCPCERCLYKRIVECSDKNY